MAAPNDEKAIFWAALEKAAPQERSAYLQAACAGDPELLKRVQELLNAHQGSIGPLDVPPPGVGASPTLDQSTVEAPGTHIGPYKLLQKLGEGGMGVVYMAEQKQPVERRVALKIIKPGMDTRQVIARFEAERQALALMDHPHIARVLDAGTTDGGRPFFVMELVKGIPITQYCDEHQLTPRERLELFVPVCQAVQHAHHKGIIHRDLKPTNVLVAKYDQQAVPKIIDFGVAKAIGPRLTEKTMFTEFGQVVGTIEYMSPEQAKLNQLDIDTRTDIYSLGVLLYELLTGATPFDRQRLRSAAFDEMLRIIREEEPPKPSTRLSTSGALPSIAASRHTEAKKLTTLVRGELDWIVMKALEKDRNRRYETANSLAMDVQRYLHDETVLACPPSAAYRFRKFARRNKAPLAMAASVALAVLLTMVGLAVSNIWVRQERNQKDEALKEKGLALDAAEKHRQQAQHNLKEALRAVDQMLTRVADEKLLNVPQMEPVRRELLLDALKFYQDFLRENSADPVLRFETGQAWWRVGYIQERLGRYAQADKAFVSSIALLEKLVDEFPAEPAYRSALANSYLRRGTLNTWLLNDYRSAENALNRCLALRAALAEKLPDAPEHRWAMTECQANLGQVFFQTGRARQAEEAHRRAVELCEDLAKSSHDPHRRFEWFYCHYRLGHVFGLVSTS